MRKNLPIGKMPGRTDTVKGTFWAIYVKGRFECSLRAESEEDALYKAYDKYPRAHPDAVRVCVDELLHMPLATLIEIRPASNRRQSKYPHEETGSPSSSTVQRTSHADHAQHAPTEERGATPRSGRDE